MEAEAQKSVLHTYIAQNPGFQRAYDAYQADHDVLEAIRSALPTAHMVVVCEYWCGDSRRLVPLMARIVERLPSWTVEVLPWSGVTRASPYQVRAIPTFIVYRQDKEGSVEIGRIVERSDSGSLETDLLRLIS